MNEISIKTQQGILEYATNYATQNNIIFSKGYNMPVAMNNMWLTLLESNDKNGCLQTCSDLSIEKAIKDCLYKELDTGKTQGYFIPYGKELKFQPSYFGEIKRARDVANVNINSWVIHDGEAIDIETRIDGSLIIHHKPDFKCFNKEIIGAYAVATDITTGRVINSDIMTTQEIVKSLTKSKSGALVAKEFKNQMYQRTVVKRLAKRIVNTSDDSLKLTITDIDGNKISITNSDDLYNDEEYDYTINTQEQIDKEKQKYEPAEGEDVVTMSDLQVTPIESEPAEIPENAIEIDYNLVKGGQNRDKYRVVPNTFNKATYTCMAVPLE